MDKIDWKNKEEVKNYNNDDVSLLLLCRRCHKNIHIELNEIGGK